MAPGLVKRLVEVPLHAAHIEKGTPFMLGPGGPDNRCLTKCMAGLPSLG